MKFWSECTEKLETKLSQEEFNTWIKPLRADINKNDLEISKDLVIIGAGYIGLEVAAIASQKGISVTVLEMADRVMNRTVDKQISEYYRKLHEEHGVNFKFNSSLKAIKGGEKPDVVICSDGSEIKADMVIKALGFDPEDLPYLFDSKELQVTKWGTLKTNFDTMETNLEGVFAAGDIVRGASLVVWAIKDGRDAAIAIKNYLESKELKKTKVA